MNTLIFGDFGRPLLLQFYSTHKFNLLAPLIGVLLMSISSTFGVTKRRLFGAT
jgi:hypothetical protein